MSAPSPCPVAVLGAGSIGLAFAVVFARAGHDVALFDPDGVQLARVPDRLRARLVALAEHGLLTADIASTLGRVRPAGALADAVAGAAYVAECGPEQLPLKRELLAEVDRLAPPDAVIASASSFIPISRSAAHLPGRGRALVAHPGNPPFLIPVIELVPAPFTDPAAVETAAAVLRRAGMTPVHVRREVEGFVFNRLQGALLREAYCLVRDGVASVEDIDVLVRDGLGLRWSVVGPFETVDLNTRGGIASHADKMGPFYERMGAERGQHDPWTPDLVAEVEAQRRARLPLDGWDDRVAWRDEALMRLVRDRAARGDDAA